MQSPFPITGRAIPEITPSIRSTDSLEPNEKRYSPVISGLNRVVAVLAIIAAFSAVGFGNRCRCVYATACQSYTLSDRVFIGRFVTISDPDQPPSQRKGIFEVVRTLKGESSEREEVHFAVDCDRREFEVGKEYLVFSYPEPYREQLCDLTDLVANSSRGVAMTNLLSSEPFLFSIEGRVGIPEGTDHLKGIRIEIDSAGNTEVISPDSKGHFRFSVKRPGNYNVTVKYPDGLDLTVHHLGFEQRAKECPFRYQVKVDRSGCDYREFLLESFLSEEMWELRPSGR